MYDRFYYNGRPGKKQGTADRTCLCHKGKHKFFIPARRCGNQRPYGSRLRLCMSKSHAARRVRKRTKVIFAGDWGVPNKHSEAP